MKYLLIPSCDVAAVDRLEGTSTELRLKRGLRIWKKDRSFDKILLTGGICYPKVQTIPAGKLMFTWLISRNINPGNILFETRSRDTYQDIEGALELTQDDPEREIVVVSHWQHVMRFWLTFRLAHDMWVKVVPMFYWFGLKTFIQEWVFLAIHLIDTYGTSRLVRGNRESRT